MADERWEEQFKQFLRKTGDDFRRAGEDVKTEAQRLFDAAVDPEKQQKVRDRLKELTGWARKTADGVAGMVETAASKAEQAFHRATGKVTEATEKVSPSARKSSARASKKAAGGKAKGGRPAQKSKGKRKR
jgi:hypothetical protein